ncbi:hypothetical protein W03_19230 [Nitrosomonas sp. PY1]|uniref:response regulator n=1 Tax=Nitrosomonas sp. PY1 TaxID=1803906 RepID=UPI001FC8459F|nr:response regulator [Nitrosomonas sp. PY1]GKS69919.1 hypothetical protein W03_19230 [Nitrosomonas sp. PY1]
MRVLYIDNTLTNADIARRTLARTAPDIELTTVTLLVEGLKCLEKPDYYDALLTDLHLPDGSGLEAVISVRKRRLPLAVVVAGSGDYDAATAAFKANADDYLIKEGNYLERLPHTLRSALARFRSKGEDYNSLASRVLYVEHNSFDSCLMHRHLAQHAPHINLTAVSSAQDALALLPADPEKIADFDILLINSHLPGMDGLELVRLLREERKLNLPIVLITGQGGEMVVARALDLGVEDYLPKHEGYFYEVPAILEKAQRKTELVRENASLRQANSRLLYLLAASPVVLYNLRFMESVPQPVWVSENVERLLGYTTKEALNPDWWPSHLHPDDRELAVARQSTLLTEDQLTHGYRFSHHDGRFIWILDELRLMQNSGDQPREVVGAWLDISKHKRIELIRQTHQSVLNQIIANQPLPAILNDIAKRLEEVNSNMLVSISLLDRRASRLKHGASLSLPDDYNAVANQFLELTHKANLHASWSLPFKDENDKVLGAFIICYRTLCEPTFTDLSMVHEFASIAVLAVQQVQAKETLRQTEVVFEFPHENDSCRQLRVVHSDN